MVSAGAVGAKQSGKRGGYAPGLHYLCRELILFIRDDF